jgi:hypothetical protein
VIKNSQLYKAGLGVFTNVFIPSGSVIDEYLGDIYEYPTGGSYCFSVSNDYFIDASNFPRCYTAMINDASYKPKINMKKKKQRKLKKMLDEIKFENNCKFSVDEVKKRVYIVAVRDINESEELFVSYGTEYW